MNRITLVIPAKNEEKSLPYVLDEIRSIKCKKLLIVTKINKKILKLKKIYKFNLILQEKDGYGSAIIEGIKKVKTKYLCIYNADGSFDPKTLNKMYNIIKIDEKKFVFASRYEEKGGSLDDTFLTYIGNKIFTFIGNFFFKLKLSDILFTYVMGVTKNFNKLNLQSRDFRLCVEIPIKIKENSLLINTTASHERRRIAGVKNVNEFRDGFLILLYLLKKFLKNE
jgi:glycosyltransferase involved in cell wall biosynthesis